MFNQLYEYIEYFLVNSFLVSLKHIQLQRALFRLIQKWQKELDVHTWFSYNACLRDRSHMTAEGSFRKI